MIEYSDNFPDTSGSLWQCKRDEIPNSNSDLTTDSSQSFEYNEALVGKTSKFVANTNSSVEYTYIFLPLKYLSNFWTSLEMPLTN